MCVLTLHYFQESCKNCLNVSIVTVPLLSLLIAAKHY